MEGKGCTHTLRVESGHGWRMLEKVRTHPLQDQNDVSSEFISDKREGRTRCESENMSDDLSTGFEYKRDGRTSWEMKME